MSDAALRGLLIVGFGIALATAGQHWIPNVLGLVIAFVGLVYGFFMEDVGSGPVVTGDTDGAGDGSDEVVDASESTD